MQKRIFAILIITTIILSGCALPEKLAPLPTDTPAPTPEPTAAPTPEPTPEPVRESEIIKVTYDTVNYFSDQPATKPMSVYLPKGYSDNEQYNVAVALHILGCNEDFWPGLGVKDIMDELISSGQIEPTIVFMPDCYIDDHMRALQGDQSVYVQMSKEMRNDLIPYIQKNYSVSKDRNDYACLGASFGAYMTVNSALCTNLDLFSYFGSIGGGYIQDWKLKQNWEECGTQDLNVNMLYLGEGVLDDYGPVEQAYIDLKAGCDKFGEDNLKFQLYKMLGHEAGEWTRGFEEGMMLFFGVNNDS